ncbi:YceI family protein [Niastella caeni]|uniref:YceI family protein n=1 Tax=Niastella caeni TaxID=2569763 RepID=A0A4S8HLH4_9BACT|nr:YceI family protein [Niastella caeni]THU36015.1 YceI family protein [Niastella caeni]
MSQVKWTLDPMHSEITFKVKHLMISTVTGQFRNFNVVAETAGNDFSKPGKIDVTIDVASIDTNNEQRDGHLKSDDFFSAANHNQITFKGIKFEANGEEGKLHGELTIKGTTKPVVLNVENGGVVVDPYGQTKAGFTVSGKLSRKEFGLTWSAVTEAGNVVVGDDIKFTAEIQLVKQAA